MIKLSRNIMGRSPEEAVRRLCLGILGEAEEGLARMDDPQDTEALHDFRVALRRLRSLLRAYRQYLRGSINRKLRERIKMLAGSTNLARDTEVQLEWLETNAPKMPDDERSAAEALAVKLRSHQATTPSASELREGFSPLKKSLTKRLSRMELGRTSPSHFVAATARLIEEHMATLFQSLESAESDPERLHDARIEAKRLRYILEPLQLEFDEARALVREMKTLQDCLGELQDTRVMTESISHELERSAIENARILREMALREEALPEEPPGTGPGLLALLKTQRVRREACLAEVAQSWRGTALSTLLRRVDDFVERLRIWPGEDLPTRRFLLRGLPDVFKKQRGHLVREGWLPGKEIVERVRSVREGRRLRYVRLVTHVSANGSARPTEESLTKKSFDAFWPLTEGRRLEAHRYEMEDSGRRWTIEEIAEPALVLASISSGADLAIPEWLQPEIVREVTGVQKYEPERLARASARSAP